MQVLKHGVLFLFFKTCTYLHVCIACKITQSAILIVRITRIRYVLYCKAYPPISNSERLFGWVLPQWLHRWSKKKWLHLTSSSFLPLLTKQLHAIGARFAPNMWRWSHDKPSQIGRESFCLFTYFDEMLWYFYTIPKCATIRSGLTPMEPPLHLFPLTCNHCDPS